MKFVKPKIYDIQLKAMEVMFCILLIDILDGIRPKDRNVKQYIKPNHWHKK